MTAGQQKKVQGIHYFWVIQFCSKSKATTERDSRVQVSRSIGYGDNTSDKLRCQADICTYYSKGLLIQWNAAFAC
eukprot:995284-Pelagomonas_calceolata.AAC.1